MQIIEAITRNGIVSTDSSTRPQAPHSGDHVRWPNGTLGRIWEAGTGHCKPGQAQVCEDQGSAFLTDEGNADISGGPFRIIALADLKPTYEFHWGTYWNWGNNRPAAHQGVEFKIARPIFEYVGDSDDEQL